MVQDKWFGGISLIIIRAEKHVNKEREEQEKESQDEI
jgi:hypothetical protein